MSEKKIILKFILSAVLQVKLKYSILTIQIVLTPWLYERQILPLRLDLFYRIASGLA